jgi:hypothetical protein
MSEFSNRKTKLFSLLAVICTAAGVYAYDRYSFATKQHETWRTARYCVTTVDFSRAGEVRIDLPVEGADAPHGFLVYIDPGCEDLPSPLPRGEVRVEQQVSEARSIPLTDVLRKHHRDDNGVFLCMTRGLAQSVTIQVAEGSPAWAGLKSVVFGRYWLCGFEAVPVLLWGLLACTAGLLAAIFWAVVVWRLACSRPVLPTRCGNSVTSCDAEPRDAMDSRQRPER